MKKIFRSLAALAVVTFAGCVNELTNEGVGQSDKTTVTVSFTDTKTYLGDLEDGSRKVYWSDGDQISINGVASSSVALSDDKRKADFTFDAVLDYPYSILYPAEMYKDAQTITLPAVQAAANDSFAGDSAPMASYQAAAGTITLHHLAGVIRLQVKLPAESNHGHHPLSKVEIRGNAGEQMSGDFAIDYEALTLTGTSTADADMVVTAKSGKALSADSNVDVFVVVPARRYEQGFTVRLIDAAGHYMDIATNNITVAAGEIKAMPVVPFAPTGTLVGVEIASASNLVAFAKAYNAGEYAELDNLNVQVVSDIVFDDETNAEWETIDMIGSSGDSNWFNGVFDGQNHSIKNWVASRPLFYATTANTCIENLNIDASCTLTAPYTSDEYYGGLVGYHTGLLYNCHNNASVEVSGEWASAANVGGLVGRIASYGKIEACSMSGNVIADATFVVSGTSYLGGIAGCIAAAGGKILDSEFKGTLTANGGSGDSQINYIGGITGLAGGTVVGCSTLTDKAIVAAYESANAVTIYLGGIAGNVKEGGNVNKSDNNASVSFSCPKPSKSATAYIGGITGYIAKNVSLSECDNNNSVQSVSDYHSVYLGGLVGGVDKNATLVEDCHTLANGTVMAGKYASGMEYLYMGGIVGRCYMSNVKNISNAAAVETESIVAKGANVGGCIGFMDASIEGNNTITNSGAVTAKGNSTASTYFAQGGVVGTMYASNGTLSKVKNTGNVTDEITETHKNVFSGGVVGLVRQAGIVDHVTNEGKVHFANASQQNHENVALGGIVGGVAALSGNKFAATVSNSTNSGVVSRAFTSSGIQKSAMVCGGIVGILKGAGSSVKNCTNSGEVKIEGKNSTGFDTDFDPLTTYSSGGSGQSAGGVVGFALGASDGAVTISGCTNTGACYALRGYVGGIAGYVRNGVISASHHKTNNVTGVDYSVRTGGISGFINASSVSSCTVEAIVDGGSRPIVGGICGGMNANASIEGSTFNGTVKYSNTTVNGVQTSGAGAIVKYSETDATIKNCGAKGNLELKGTATTITLVHFDFDKNATQTGSYILE